MLEMVAVGAMALAIVESGSPSWSVQQVGAVAGGGLTVIANAPNPAGQSLLARFFKYGVSPLGLALGALPATVIIYLCLMLLPSDQPLERAPAPAEQNPAPASETPCPPPIPGRD